MLLGRYGAVGCTGAEGVVGAAAHLLPAGKYVRTPSLMEAEEAGAHEAAPDKCGIDKVTSMYCWFALARKRLGSELGSSNVLQRDAQVVFTALFVSQFEDGV